MKDSKSESGTGHTVLATIKTIRPHFTFLSILFYIAGLLFASKMVDGEILPNTGFLLLGSIVILLVYSSGCVLDAIYDLPIDLEINPERASEISRQRSWMIFVALLVIGLPLAYLVDLRLFAICVSLIPIGFLYQSHRFTNANLRNATYVAYTYLVPFFAGYILMGGGVDAYLVTWLVLLFIWGLSIRLVKDFEDMNEDRKLKRLSLPLKYGVDRGARLVSVLLFTPFILAPIPFAFLGLGLWYLVVMSILSLILAIVAVRFLRNPVREGSSVYHKATYLLAHLIPVAIILGLV
jgi:4-hydroxybenzoate polyprenyltransferase